jgi:hypothetical protein
VKKNDEGIKKFSGLSTKILKSLEVFLNQKEFTLEDKITLNKVSSIFKVTLSNKITELINSDQVFMPIDALVNKSTSRLPSATASVSLVNEREAEPKLADMFKSSDMRLMQDILKLDRWSIFYKKLLNSEELKVELEKEDNVLMTTLINFVMAYNDNDVTEMFIFCEDIMAKIVNIIEFFKQKNLGDENLLFLVNLISKIIVSCKSKLEKEKMQNMFNNAGIIRVIFKIFSQQTTDNLALLRDTISLCSSMLDGCHKVRDF